MANRPGASAKRSTAIFLVAVSIIVALACAGPVSARPRPRTQTVTATYTQAGWVWVYVVVFGVFVPADFLTGATLKSSEYHVFGVPTWASSARVSVSDATGLPVQFTTLPRNSGGYDWRTNCTTPVAIDLKPWHGESASLEVAVADGFLTDCRDPVSIPTTGRITVMFES